MDEAQSKNILGELFNELDQNDADDLNEAKQAFAQNGQVVNEHGLVAFSKHEEMQFKAANAITNQPVSEASAAISSGKLVPSANPFSKKRQHSEITKPDEPATTALPAQETDVAMHDEFKSAASDVKMQSAAESEHENLSAVKGGVSAQKSNPNLPNSISNTEEDWRRLKQQNVELNNEIRTVDAQQTLNS